MASIAAVSALRPRRAVLADRPNPQSRRSSRAALSKEGRKATHGVLGSFIYANREQGRFALPAVVLDLFAIMVLTALIRQITLALQVDYGMPINAIQKQIETLKILRIRSIRGIFLAATLAWTPLLIVVVKGVFGWDAYRLFGTVYLIANMLLGLAVIPLAIGLSKRYGDRIGRWPVIQRLMRDPTGYSLTTATDFLATLSELKDEK